MKTNVMLKIAVNQGHDPKGNIRWQDYPENERCKDSDRDYGVTYLHLSLEDFEYEYLLKKYFGQECWEIMEGSQVKAVNLEK